MLAPPTAYLVVAPPAGMLMRKYGYKKGIHAGLTIFSIGAVMFWPAAIYHKYGSEFHVFEWGLVYGG